MSRQEQETRDMMVLLVALRVGSHLVRHGDRRGHALLAAALMISWADLIRSNNFI